MQLTTTFILLVTAAYVRADQCIACPQTIDGQSLEYTCAFDGETSCVYTGGDDMNTGPFCIYWDSGQYMGICDYSGSDPSCPINMGKTLYNCDTCPTTSDCCPLD